MYFVKIVTISAAILLTTSSGASFSKLHDICETTKVQSCPNNAKEIALLQKFLNYGKDKKLTINGKYDRATKEAVISFQKKHGLPATGYVGTLTKNELDRELKKLLSKVKASNKSKTKVVKKNIKPKKLAKRDSKKINLKVTKKVIKKVVKKVVKKDIKPKKLAKRDSKKINLKKISSYEAFKKSVNLRKSFAVFKDHKLLSKAGRAKTVLKVDISEQRVKLLVDGKVALSAPCTTGSKHKLEPNTKTYRDKRTPIGTFKILEKIATKRSNIFGNIYRNGKLIYHGDRRKYRGSWKGVKFVGAPLYKWMRLTSSGIGLHASKYIKRYPGSNGCIRLPKNVANTLFSKLKKGTIVKVVN